MLQCQDLWQESRERDLHGIDVESAGTLQDHATLEFNRVVVTPKLGAYVFVFAIRNIHTTRTKNVP